MSSRKRREGKGDVGGGELEVIGVHQAAYFFQKGMSVFATPTSGKMICHLKTIGEENGDDLTTVEEDGTVTLDEEQWCLIAALPRGRGLYDVTKFVLTAPGRKRKKNLLKQLSLCEDIRMVPNDEWDDGDDEERQRRWNQGVRLYEGQLRSTLRREPTVKGLNMGYSMYMYGPVVIRPSRPGDGTPNVRHQVGCANFEGSEFKVELDGSVAGR
ncbi:hypothetical protein GGI35DRAFT_476139 [Trichoderma velutinum]